MAQRLTEAAPADELPPHVHHRLQQSSRALRAKHRSTDLSPWIPVTL